MKIVIFSRRVKLGAKKLVGSERRDLSRRDRGTRPLRRPISFFVGAQDETRAYRPSGCIASRPMLNDQRGAPGRKLMPARPSSCTAARLLPLPDVVPDSAGHRVMNPLCAVPRRVSTDFFFTSPLYPLSSVCRCSHAAGA